MLKDMSSRNRPKFNTESGLTPNGGGAVGERPGSAPARIAARPPRPSRAGVRSFFAPGTPASAAAAPGGSGGLPVDVDELAATLGRRIRVTGDVAVELAAAAPAAGVDTEASSRPGTAAAGPDVEPDAQPARWDHRRDGQQVDVPGDVARANPCTPPPPGGPFSVWR